MKKEAKKQMPYRDMSLPIADRVADLLERLTLQEKIRLMSSNTPAIERLDIPRMNCGGECLHGLVHTGKATVFPSAVSLAATFDTNLIYRVADAISSEARAKFHDKAWHGPKGPRVGLTFWTPNINIFRDPRWGRGQETYGEDPYLTGAIGAAFVCGLQGKHPRYLKTAACAKHFAVHSGPERLRGTFDAVVTKKDLFETYLPAFKALVDADVASVMAAYNRVNGEACCGSRTLLVETLRKKWGFKGWVVSDAGAIHGMHAWHKVTADAPESAALGIKMGCDMDIGGGSYSEKNIMEAIRRGLVTEADVDKCVARIMAIRFRLGLFDKPGSVPYEKIRSNVIQCPRHTKLAYETALKSMVLLKNNGVLPIKKDVKTVFVTGPNAGDLQVLLGNFYRGVSARLVSVLEGIVNAAPEGTAVTHMQGCHLGHPNEFPSTWAFGLAEWADVVVAVIGVSPLQEGESGECIASKLGGDRDGIALPANQVEFVQKLAKLGKPLVAVVTGGSPIAMPEIDELADAVLFAGYPGEQGGTAVGDILFGRAAPSGRLCVTFPKSEKQLPPFEEYALTNRTYRYMKKDPLYPFGFGLSYTQFKYGKMKISTARVRAGKTVEATVSVRNAGGMEAEEVVQLYLTHAGSSLPQPLWALKAFQRIRLRPGKSGKVTFNITPDMMALVNKDGDLVLEPGTVTVTIGGSSPGKRALALGASRPAVAAFRLVK